VFGRTGTITAQSGDYSFTLLSGSPSVAQLGSGTASTSTWLRGDQTWQSLPSLTGDVTGTIGSNTVTALQGRAVASTAPSSGQALVWNGSIWQPSTISGSSGGATMAYQLGDFAVTYTSATVLTIGGNCAPTSPCNVRFGYQVFSITNSATATISSNGTGTAYIYVTATGSLIVGHNLTVTCSAGCTQQSGVTAFPANVIPVATWTATNGNWNASGGADQRAFLSSKVLAGGQGIIVTEAPGQTTLAVDNGVIPTYLMNSATLTFPSIPSGACAADQTLTVTGANTGDAVAPGWPAGLPSGLIGIMLVNSSNTVNVRLCNMSSAAIQPPSASYKATIVRNY
jgi:hypothetical protein